MATAFNYPGVYVEEISSGVHTIVGVSTSDTAFIDFFPKGPVNQATRITSIDDFARTFGGLDKRSEASYAIQQFFLNGGSVAWVVRAAPGAGTSAASVKNAASKPIFDVNAASPGAWGDSLRFAVQDGTPATTTFNLVVQLTQTVNGAKQVVRQEIHRNLTMTPGDSQYAIDVVNDASDLVQLSVPASAVNEIPPLTPAATWVSLPGSGTGTSDGDAPGTAGWPTSGPKAIADAATRTGALYALERIAPAVFNLLCIPAAADFVAATADTVYAAATAYCIEKRAFLIRDISSKTAKVADMVTLAGTVARDDHVAMYFPRLEIPDPLNGYRPRNVGASGTLAGIYARTDANRGIWKAPAGIEATLVNANLARDATGTAINLTDGENGQLNPLGINVLRNFPIYGNVTWGARTLKGADAQASEWKYVPVRRLALYIEESLFQGSKWIVFEPNDEPLWAQIRLNFGAFMQNLFRQGAFQGQSPSEAYFVRCDKNTTTQNDIDLGIVNILVGFAPLKPAEFVVISIQQMAGQIAT